MALGLLFIEFLIQLFAMLEKIYGLVSLQGDGSEDVAPSVLSDNLFVVQSLARLCL
jgi:2-hydroxy-3-keto-5-methylthiopentenyl-1-phosphate phosphatase